LWQGLQPLAVPKMPLEIGPPRSARFGSPLVLNRVHWVRRELVAEVQIFDLDGRQFAAPGRL
jgi:hypothetical protein